MPAVRRSGFTWDLILLSVLAQNFRALCTGELRPGNLEHPEWNSTKLSVMDLSVCAQSLTFDRTTLKKKRLSGGRASMKANLPFVLHCVLIVEATLATR
jgi:hypothetical protein